MHSEPQDLLAHPLIRSIQHYCNVGEQHDYENVSFESRASAVRLPFHPDVMRTLRRKIEVFEFESVRQRDSAPPRNPSPGAVGAVYDRALFFSSITSSGCYEKSCAIIDRAYSRRKFKVSHPTTRSADI